MHDIHELNKKTICEALIPLIIQMGYFLILRFGHSKSEQISVRYVTVCYQKSREVKADYNYLYWKTQDLKLLAIQNIC